MRRTGKSKSSLEEFFENYINNKRITNSAESFDEYRARSVPDYDAEYSRGVESAYLDAMRSRADRGTGAERIFSSGLSGSGYARRLYELSKGNYEKQLSELSGERGLKKTRALLGYADYLSDYGRRQDSLMNTVRGELIKNGVINAERAYEYALGRGLSDDRARAVSGGIYSVLKDKIIADLIDRVITYRLDAKSAGELAEKYGLNPSDTEYVRREAERLRGSDLTVGGDELSRLESEADKVTSSFK